MQLAILTLSMLASVVMGTNQCTRGPCGPGNSQCGPQFDQTSPQFHVRDLSCTENDPNGPFYYNGVYHLMYQDHLAIPPGHGPDWGHAASADLVHWTHLPVAIWNDQPYDVEAIFTGSTSMVNGKPVIIYPGLCNKQTWSSCQTGTLLAVALPANLSDPLLIEWMKPDYNPIMNNTQRDPTTAWQTTTGEWRITTYDSSVYTSMDFQKWTVAAGSSGFPVGECPSFFLLPGGPSPSTGATHVHKASYGGKDWMQVGRYDEGAPGTSGNWTGLLPAVKIDAGDFYASKDFYDPVRDRRINWGWAKVPPASTQTLPRVITWDEELQQLLYTPAQELQALRESHLLDTSSITIPANGTAWLGGGWPNSGGNQSEIYVKIQLPSKAATITLHVAAGASGNLDGLNISTPVTATFEPGSANVTVGIGIPGSELTQYMQHTDLPGGDFVRLIPTLRNLCPRHVIASIPRSRRNPSIQRYYSSQNVTNVNYTDPKICENACFSNPECQAYTYVVRPPLRGSCCQKGENGWHYNPSVASCTSGVRTPRPAPTSSSSTLSMKQTDSYLEMHVYIDNTFVEAYWQGGRVAMTRTIELASPVWGFALSTTGEEPLVVASVEAYAIGSIWVDNENVRNTAASQRGIGSPLTKTT